jgi:predicted esterase
MTGAKACLARLSLLPLLAGLLPSPARGSDPSLGALTARFEMPPGSSSAQTGLRALGGGALLFVPKGYRPGTPAPLIVMLHGAGGTPERAIELVQRQAARRGILVLAPKSAGATWDAILYHAFGRDVTALDSALAKVAGEYSVDPRRVAIAGFSDGASYALSLGLSNGALFRNVLAFSAGFMVSRRIEGRPRIFLSHGRGDRVLPVELCGRALARRLEAAGYAVTYDEFSGRHELPERIAEEAISGFVAG